MAYYKSDPRCRCARCRFTGILWPVLLITFGVLILLSEANVRNFHETFPVLFIVAGIVKVLQYTASTEGHLGYEQPQAYVTPPPVAPGGQMPPQDPSAGNEGVNHG